MVFRFLISFFALFARFLSDAGGTLETPPPNPSSASQPDLAQQVQNLVARYGSPDAVGIQLLTENREYRRRIDELKHNQVPEGAIVLSGEDVQRWQAYQALGTLDDVQTRLTERDQLNERLTSLERRQTIADTAQLVGYRANVLERLPNAQSLTFSVRDETENGQTVRRAYVSHDGQDELLTTYAEREWVDFLPSLLEPSIQPPSGTGYVKQGQGKAPTTDPIALHNRRMGYAPPQSRS